MKHTCLLCLMMSAFVLPAWCEWKEPPPGLPDTFTIGLQASDRIVDSDYALAAQAGFNLVVPIRPGLEPSQALLKACSAAGIKAVVWDSRFSTYDLGDWAVYGKAFADYRGSNAVAGYMAYDSITVPPARVPWMGWHMRELGGSAPDQYRYCELVPMNRLTPDGYRRYVRHYLGSIASFALYEETDPFSADALRAMKITVDAANSEGKVWWRRCRLADTTPEMIRWQAYSAAAAGAKGIIYLIARPIDTGSPATSRSDSLLDPDGKPTGAFEAAKAVNARLTAIGPILMKAVKPVFYTTGTMPENVEPPAGAPITAIRSSVEGDGFLVGVLGTGDERYAMVVRKPSPGAEPASLQLQFAAGVSAAAVDSGEPAERLALLPGEGTLTKIK
ncbi:MAG TPA: hypothetical protein VM223_19210 [Planctomycetota bacterium]|nr:hypothetical protein [Planctomycetota bacterium]